MTTLVALAVFGVVGYRMMSETQRRRAAHDFLTLAAWLVWRETPAGTAFRQALRRRTPWILATPVLVTINVWLFVLMAQAPGPIAVPETLIEWGGSFGPRTTNGEWWRLVTASFVHSRFLALAVNMIALVQAGRVLERLVGPLALVVVYVAAGTFGAVVSLPGHPLAVTAGASGAVCGVYGLLLATWVRSVFPRSPLTIPFDVIKAVAPAAAVFVAFNVLADGLSPAGEAFGLFVGVAAGTALVRRVSERRPTANRVGVTFATSMAIALAAAVPLRGIVDVRPEMRALVAFEDRTAGAYLAVVNRLRAGGTTDAALVAVIKDQILPELDAARTSLRALGRVPSQHQPLVDGAQEYLRLREQSWHLRLDALNGAGMAKLREAEIRERSALEVIDRLRSA